MVRIVTLFLAAPGDVAPERMYVADAVQRLNRDMAHERAVRFEVLDWKTHARPRVDERGPQGPIDEDMPVGECDIVVGIFWNRLGTPIPEMGGETGTEHEIRTAIAAWRKSGKPEVVVCFNDAPFKPRTVDESEQVTQVLRFRFSEELRGLELAYNGPDDFRDKVRDYLGQYLKAHYPVAPGHVTNGKVPPAIAGDPARYIKALREETSRFDVQGLKFGDNRAYRFPINEFYIPITTTSGAGARLHAGPVPLQEAMAAHRKLLVVGDPGSGKSTFLKRVAFDLSRDWKESELLPVRIEAAVLSTYIALHHGKTGPPDPASPDWIPLFLGAQCEEKNRNLAADYFRARLQAGGCHVLIDGLDETPDERSRELLAKLIREAAAAFDGCRFVVTSRPEGKVPIQGFEEALIGDLEPEAIRAFLAKLARQLYPEDETRECTFREELEAAVNGRREIRKMTRNPVMLTALAVLQHNNVKLPEKRVDLYGSILDWLSKQRAKPGRMPASDCLLRLRELALAMQNHEEGPQKQVTLAWAGEKLAKRFTNRETAERFLRAEQADSGIVVSRGKEIAYWHLTFQEYLAALEIAGWEDGDQYNLLLDPEPTIDAKKIEARIYKPEWRETVLLYSGLLYNTGPRKVDSLLRRVLDKMSGQPNLADRAKCVGFIGALLPDLVGYTVSDGRYGESLRLVLDIFDAEKSESVPFQDRLAAAEALGQAGDPRLAKHEWVTIPPTRNYWIGAQNKDPKGRNYDSEADDDEMLRQVNLASFRIGKYPVTVVQYAAFMEDGDAPNREPENWEEQQEHQNWPVVNVDWRQAAAYCEWAGGRLPTEEEWERVARGQKGTKYPWGNGDIDRTRANYAESNIGHPTPVGLYPHGASAEGVCDLVGNVLEWTLSEWSTGSGTYVWRGGSFGNNRGDARSSFRIRVLPSSQYPNLGFRLAGWNDTAANLAFLRNRARADEDAGVRQAAVRELARGWKDDPDTLSFLQDSVLSDEGHSVRKEALQELALGWPNHSSIAPLLRDRARFDAHESVRSLAVKELARIGVSDPDTLDLLKDRARSDQSDEVRTTALNELALAWKDDAGVLDLLKICVRNAEAVAVRLGAVSALANQFSENPEVQDLLIACVKDDPSSNVRYRSVLGLANHIADGRIRSTLLRVSKTDPTPHIREWIQSAISNNPSPWKLWLMGKVPEDEIPARPCRIEVGWVRLKNIRMFEDVEIAFDSRHTLIVGENATGKSTVLRAIAIAALGRDLALKADPRTASYVREGAEKGLIEVLFRLYADKESAHLTDEFTVALEIRAGESSYLPAENSDLTSASENCLERLGVIRRIDGLGGFGFLCAYGSKRTFTDPSQPLSSKPDAVVDRVASLFDVHATVIDPDKVSKLLSGNLSIFSKAPPILGDDSKRAMRESLGALLPEFRVSDGLSGSMISLHDIATELRDLSDGYASLLAFTGHLFQHALSASNWAGNPSEVYGVLLIDEIDAHLHPAWQRHILPDLQRVFPNLQIIVSTHSAMVAGSAETSSIRLLTRKGDSVDAISDIPSIKGWRADQILTSILFDLPTTMSRDSEELSEKYGKLLIEFGPNHPLVKEIETQIDSETQRIPSSTPLDPDIWDLLDEFTAFHLSKLTPDEIVRVKAKMWGILRG